MEPRQVGAGRGWKWIVGALQIFRQRPLVWLMLHTLLLLIGSALMRVPLIGPLVFALLTPVFTAGLMLACRTVENGGRVELVHLFRGFRHNATQLVTVGGVYLVGQVLVAGVMLYLGGDELRSVASGVIQDAGDVSAASVSTDRLSFALLIGAALFTPLAMAVWFAPPLIALDAIPAFAAMKLSIRACLSNLLAILVYAGGLAALLLVDLFVVRLILSALPPGAVVLRNFTTVAGFMLWVTLTVISVYASYRDLFASVVEDEPMAGAPS